MEIKSINYKPNGVIVKLIIDGTNYIIKTFDKKDNIISEYSTLDYSYARRLYRLATI